MFYRHLWESTDTRAQREQQQGHTEAAGLLYNISLADIQLCKSSLSGNKEAVRFCTVWLFV